MAHKIDNDSTRMIFFESVTWTDEFNVSFTETGFTHVPGGEEYAKQSVFSFHYYSLPNVGELDNYFYERVHDAYSWKCAAFLTEFDISNEQMSPETFDKQSRVMDECDNYKISWIGWEYKPLAGSLPNGTCTGCGYGIFLPNGTVNEMVAKVVSRTFAQFVSGNVQLIQFDKGTAVFKLNFFLNTTITQPTVVYANLKYWYPQGYDLTYSPTQAIASVTTSTDGQYTQLFNTRDTSFDGTLTFPAFLFLVLTCFMKWNWKCFFFLPFFFFNSVICIYIIHTSNFA
ncbi:glycosyl hydrolase family protein [Reticulomyxa filosa]|uniref:Glycosyl hydrolase family protein n=1 Tax=Reticulomyxa filosa TaxID=46433 RepID=X6N759_RETFI|nr:glycosyl hydrolase family protein [Reticulomyxa filosa]|eukprot:ETO21589.1 glycosyl hydrolase family protein [Reticulomyxa filosa]